MSTGTYSSRFSPITVLGRNLDPVDDKPVKRRHRAVRWLVVCVVLVAGGLVALDVARSGDSGSALSPADPHALLEPARTGSLPPFTGTAVAQISQDTAVLGRVGAAPVPELSLAGLSAGSHTVRIWHGTRNQSRVAFVRPSSETDLFRSDAGQWTWDSAQRVAVRGTSPDSTTSIWTSTATPGDLVRSFLRAGDSEFGLAGAEEVADRDAYGVVIRPLEEDTLIDYVYVAVDGATKVPLSVQIYPVGSSDPAVDVSFTDIRFGVQPAGIFAFRPPSDATVRAAADQPRGAATIGSGWAPVLCYRLPVATRATSRATPDLPLAEVRGPWGRGRLVASPLVSVLVVDDGRAYAGPVPPEALYEVATADKAAMVEERPVK